MPAGVLSVSVVPLQVARRVFLVTTASGAHCFRHSHHSNANRALWLVISSLELTSLSRRHFVLFPQVGLTVAAESPRPCIAYRNEKPIDNLSKNSTA